MNQPTQYILLEIQILLVYINFFLINFEPSEFFLKLRKT